MGAQLKALQASALLCHSNLLGDSGLIYPAEPRNPSCLGAPLLWTVLLEPGPSARRTTDSQASLQHPLPKSRESLLVWKGRVKPSSPRCFPETWCLCHLIPLFSQSSASLHPTPLFLLNRFWWPLNLKLPKQPKTKSLFLKGRGDLNINSL